MTQRTKSASLGYLPFWHSFQECSESNQWQLPLEKCTNKATTIEDHSFSPLFFGYSFSVLVQLRQS